MNITIEYKDLIFLENYLSTIHTEISNSVRESYADEETSLDEIGSLASDRDNIGRILSIIKQQK
tara:strand:- start:892 stop:1083 length:192 start_codon:yes stop_codon:yes gene_type:complete